ncbi:hypothetical protein H634G_09823 [Metarhizium anisopliae BRIP 53293]|uniref:Uncharacterized protein n=1 Tax=Metarhizium anisopliae BRIP 53293 TaxID=1291518 RepID=A0A0D9NLF8_METAN|nr:hypothetical protein H634G_09823 [Metarhizium anisopliae BRIP 53293]KJK86115.1 hypothetical protein H633G_10035 [Metarhizium anisopliae BRIP 53284]
MPETVNRPPASEYASSAGRSNSSGRGPRKKFNAEQKYVLNDMWEKYEKLNKQRLKPSFFLYPQAFQKRVVDTCNKRARTYNNLYRCFEEQNEQESRDRAELEAFRQARTAQQAAQRAPEQAAGQAAEQAPEQAPEQAAEEAGGT